MLRLLAASVTTAFVLFFLFKLNSMFCFGLLCTRLFWTLSTAGLASCTSKGPARGLEAPIWVLDQHALLRKPNFRGLLDPSQPEQNQQLNSGSFKESRSKISNRCMQIKLN
jgi:hypothetical protein